VGAPGAGVGPGRPRRHPAAAPDRDLPTPEAGRLGGRFSVYTTGIGGTGIVTANRILARAAVVAGYAVQGVDQTGLSQKAGAVVSHLHIAPAGRDVTTATVADRDADLYLSGDILQAASATHLRKVAPGRTVAVVDTAFVPTATMLQTDGSVDEAGLAEALSGAVGSERTLLADSTGLAVTVFGDHLPANVVLLGAAFQRGALPLPLDAVQQAISELGRAADTNLEAFAWGRWVAHDPDAVAAALGGGGGAGPASRRRGCGSRPPAACRAPAP
jgi:indolepyruvate ferredoxin oxidoreductase